MIGRYNEAIVLDIINTIDKNAEYLSEIDGATGDGDHGINMRKGFLLAKDRIKHHMSLSQAMNILADTLIEDIGGSMGPLYGTFFSELANGFDRDTEIDEFCVLKALHNAAEEIMDIAGAKENDKTMIDTLVPAIRGLDMAINNKASFAECMNALQDAASKGAKNTQNMVAKLGRASRLGERSRGHLDAGAVSCSLIINTLAISLSEENK